MHRFLSNRDRATGCSAEISQDSMVRADCVALILNWDVG